VECLREVLAGAREQSLDNLDDLIAIESRAQR
jgi:hypothetical protein